MDKPDYVNEEHLRYLDELMETGRMTSFKVSQLMMHRFPQLSFEEVNTTITYWIYVYSDRHQDA